MQRIFPTIRLLMTIAGLGGYRTSDFLRTGLPLTLLVLATTLLTIDLVFR